LEKKGKQKTEVLSCLSELLKDDYSFSSGKILGSMCSEPHDIGYTVFTKYLEKNIGDAGIFPATLELEKKVISTIGNLLSAENAQGAIVTGGTEANILAMWTARNIYDGTRREVILPASAHFSFDKAADLLGLELRKIPLKKDGTVDIEAVENAVTPKTMALVGVAGTTGLGAVDSIPQLSEIALKHNLYLHVDAAFGGFVLPFLKEAGYPQPKFDFSLPGVNSITVDPHKMGRAPIPAGGILYRNNKYYSQIQSKVEYLAGGKTIQHTIVGTRSGASIAAVWAILEHFGREGFIHTVRHAMDTTIWLKNKIDEIDEISPAIFPIINVIGITAKGIPISDIVNRMRDKGWALSNFKDFFRLVLMPHVTQNGLTAFLEDISQYLKENNSGINNIGNNTYYP